MNQNQLRAYQNLEQGQTALKSGDRESARQLAIQAASLAPELEEVWLLMAALATPRESIAYLNKALRINPRSERARKGLDWALARLQTRPEPARSEASQPFQPNTPTIFPAPSSLPAPRSSWPNQPLLRVAPAILPEISPPAAPRETLSSKVASSRLRFKLPPFVTFTIRRFLTLPVSLLIITMLLYSSVMMLTPEDRASLYFPPNIRRITPQIIHNYVVRYHLADPFPVQYASWVQSLFTGGWGYSPVLNGEVLPALLERTPVTAELAFYSMLVFIPLGLVSGVLAGWKQREVADNAFRFAAFVSTSLPPFIFSMILISVFYVSLRWFAPERLSDMLTYKLDSQNFHYFTGFYTLDGLLNNRLDVTFDAFRHLAMPVITLALYYWATLGRITRAVTIAEKRKEYIISARARGVRENRLIWRHTLRNVLAPSFTSLALSASSLVTGTFVVEIIFNYKGVSDLLVKSMQGIPDIAPALGFSVYSTLIVLTLMFILDIIQALVDPRVRDEVLGK